MSRSDSNAPKRSVLFVCLGNICRSPTAEGLLAAHVAELGLGDCIEIDSAGTGDWHLGERADPRMRAAAAARGYSLESRSRQVQPDEFERWDLMVAMDRTNLEDLRRLGRGRGNLVLFSEFLPPGCPIDIPDPYYGGTDGFDRVLDLVEIGCAALLERLLDLPDR